MKTIIIITSILTIYIISNFFSYEEIFVVNSVPQNNFKNFNYKSKNIDDLIEESLDITLDELSFDLKSNYNSDVNKLNETHKAHCVGYSNYFNSVLHKLVVNNNLKNIKITHVRAKVKFLGVNLHIVDMKEFKDHDICVIYDNNTNKKYIVDPSLSEVFGKIIIKQ
jgi:hypothetical protein